MKFSKKIEEIKNREENREKIVLARCGIFFIAIGTDAILLNKLYEKKKLIKIWEETWVPIWRNIKGEKKFF